MRKEHRHWPHHVGLTQVGNRLVSTVCLDVRARDAIAASQPDSLVAAIGTGYETHVYACHETGEPVREEGRDWEPLIEERYTFPHAAAEGHQRHVHRLELAEALAISEQLGTPESMREVERLEALVLS